MKNSKLYLAITLIIIFIFLLIFEGFENAYSKSYSENFDEVTGLTYSIFYDDFIVITGSKENMQIINIPETINNKTVIGIESKAFSNRNDIKEVILPYTSTISIENYAFKNCFNLEKINLSNSTKLLGENIFENCFKLNIQ